MSGKKITVYLSKYMADEYKKQRKKAKTNLEAVREAARKLEIVDI